MGKKKNGGSGMGGGGGGEIIKGKDKKGGMKEKCK